MSPAASDKPLTPIVRHGRLLGVIAAVLIALSIPMGWSIHHHHAIFSEYRDRTLRNPDVPPRWDVETLSPQECVEEVVAWALECPGVQSWCEAEVPAITRTCLGTVDRTEYCEEVGDAPMSTRFGYEACADLRVDVSGAHRARAHKKYCALAYRAIAGHCRRLGEGHAG